MVCWKGFGWNRHPKPLKTLAKHDIQKGHLFLFLVPFCWGGAAFRTGSAHFGNGDSKALLHMAVNRVLDTFSEFSHQA